ncbi:MAG: histidinol-phosphate transaminase [Anaerolineae bacterium]|nr:aminotransferase class I/II-fold pyridoxal phosphate-dependent enzyme [Anaerolineales bacterium]MCQ3978380.1 histidinol-phosphate aminotransferase [Anaerolineae bacterium]
MSDKFNLDRLIRPNLARLKPYTPILPFEVLSQQLGRRPDEIIKLDANENPYGPSPRVAAALAEAPYLHIYPDPESRELRAALADYTGLAADYLLVGLGADELIDLIMRLVIVPGDTIVNCPPTFGMYAFDADINGAEVINVWRRPDFAVDIEGIEAVFTPPYPPLKGGEKEEPLEGRGQPQKSPSLPGSEQGEGHSHPKLIFVTSPNNPDGSLLGDDELKRLLALPAIVVLDEAYIEFAGASAGVGSRIEWVRDYPNLVVLRTFSKWAGLAGLRLGYGAFPLDIIAHLWKIKQPYNVPVTGQIAGLVSLSDRERLLGRVAQLVAQREQFYQVLAGITWLQAYPSQANFILCRVLGRSAVEVKAQLAAHGILVRYYNSPGLADCLRFSIGTPAQMDRLAEVLKLL